MTYISNFQFIPKIFNLYSFNRAIEFWNMNRWSFEYVNEHYLLMLEMHINFLCHAGYDFGHTRCSVQFMPDFGQ